MRRAAAISPWWSTNRENGIHRIYTFNTGDFTASKTWPLSNPMRKKEKLDLATFDAQLIDGLTFCGKVYDLFDQVKAAPNGLEHIRLRSTKIAKRLIEELIPIARYVQARYREGLRIKVKWFSGSQPYDAILWSSGDAVTHGVAPKRLLLEVTTAAHQNNYLARQQLHEHGMTWGPKNIELNKKPRQIVSKPYVYTNNEGGTNLADQIIERLKGKSAKRYPPGTVLIIICFADGLILDDEWKYSVELVEKAQQHLAFREVFLYESVSSYSATLYGKRKRARRATARKTVRA